MPLNVLVAALVAPGMLVGSDSSSRTCLAMPSGSRNPAATKPLRASLPIGSAGSSRVGSSSTAGGSGASRSKSRYCSESSTPRSPSVIVWCILAIIAALPPRIPSTMVNCQSGRVRSNGSATISDARSSTSRRPPGFGQATLRTWVSMSKFSSSTHIGGEMFAGDGITRWRSRGIVTVAYSMRRRNESKSGARSRIVTVPNVDERYGSFSSRHINPSASLMFRSKRISLMGADYETPYR